MNYDNSRVIDIIARIGNYLREPIPIASPEIKTHLTYLEALRYELLEVRVDWQKMLAEKKGQYLHPKDAQFTELDRKTMLNAQLANIERDVTFLLGLEDLINQRIELGKTLY